MSETKRRKRRPRPVESAGRSREADEAERSLGRAVALGLPLLSVVAACAIAVVGSFGSALLVLASGALLGAIALLWASVRTLSGDAPLPADLEMLAGQGHAVDALAEQKRRALRAIRDLESEHALGKIDDADYELFVARYREEAKAVMREMDLAVAPMREQAEKLAREYIERKTAKAAAAPTEPAPSSATSGVARVACAACTTSNEPDAAFCKSCGAAMKGPLEGEAPNDKPFGGGAPKDKPDAGPENAG
jgi:hypothetical protein